MPLREPRAQASRRRSRTSCPRLRRARRARRGARRSSRRSSFPSSATASRSSPRRALPTPSPTKPEVAVTDLARDISGLARDDYFDWPKAARDLVAAKTNVDVAVDHDGHQRPPAAEGRRRDARRALTDKWRAAYGQRVDALLAPFRDAHIPVVVGRPAADARRPSQRAGRGAERDLPRPRRQGRGEPTSTSGTPSLIRTANSPPSAPTSTARTPSCATGRAASISPRPARGKSRRFSKRTSAATSTRSKPQAVGSALPAGHRTGGLRHQRGDPRKGRAATPVGPGAATPLAKPSAGPIVSLTRPARLSRRRSHRFGRRRRPSRPAQQAEDAPPGPRRRFRCGRPEIARRRACLRPARRCLFGPNRRARRRPAKFTRLDARSPGRSGEANKGARKRWPKTTATARKPQRGSAAIHGAGAVHQGPVVREPERAADARSAADRAQSLGPDQRQRAGSSRRPITRSA